MLHDLQLEIILLLGFGAALQFTDDLKQVFTASYGEYVGCPTSL